MAHAQRGAFPVEVRHFVWHMLHCSIYMGAGVRVRVRVLVCVCVCVGGWVGGCVGVQARRHGHMSCTNTEARACVCVCVSMRPRVLLLFVLTGNGQLQRRGCGKGTNNIGPTSVRGGLSASRYTHATTKQP